MTLEIGYLDGNPISLGTHQEILADIGKRITEGRPGGVASISNTEFMYQAMRRPPLMAFAHGAQHSLCDGVGVIVAGWFWGLRIKRFNGPVFQLACSDHGLAAGWRHFYYGGKPGVANEMARRLQRRYPGLEVVGTYSPPFRPLTPEEDEEVVRMINASGADIVWVGLGLLKQEAWISAHLGRVNVPWMSNVGAAFDYHSGAIPWAPPLLRALGLEWLFTLIIQPRLRVRRYWRSLVFVFEVSLKGVLELRFLRRGAAARSK